MFSLAQVTVYLHLFRILQYYKRLKSCQYGGVLGTTGAHRVECETLRLSPDRSDPGLIPARGPLLHVLPADSLIFLTISLYNKG